MRRSKRLTATATAGLLTGITLAAGSPAVAAGTVSQESLTVDKGTVYAGSTVTLRFTHGPEAIGWISSPAFVRTGDDPVGTDEGLAHVVSDRAGIASATATIDHVPPGNYMVHTRVGGGCGPTETITVIQ